MKSQSNPKSVFFPYFFSRLINPAARSISPRTDSRLLIPPTLSRPLAMARGGRKKRRNFCFLSCFSDPPAWDREELDFPQDNLPLTCLTRLRSLSRTVPVVEIAGDGRGRMEVLEEMRGEEAPALISPAGNQGVGLVPKFRKFSYEEKKKIKTTVQPLAHTPLSARTHNQQPVFCHVSTKFNYRSRPLAQIRTTHPGPPQSNRRAGPARLPTRRLDPVAGLLVVPATLAGMLFFGRLCAVLCICAWFYLFSFIRQPLPAAEAEAAPPETVMDGAEEVDVDSPEYKKKVVLMGLLERSRYGGSGMPMTPTAGIRSPW